jgi:anti-anti-sigma factor
VLAEGVLTVKINARMNSDLYNEFVSLWTGDEQPASKFVIDMANCEFIDSFGLGALIILYDYALTKSIPVALINVRSALQEIFTKAEFDKIMEINYLLEKNL